MSDAEKEKAMTLMQEIEAALREAIAVNIYGEDDGYKVLEGKTGARGGEGYPGAIEDINLCLAAIRPIVERWEGEKTFPWVRTADALPSSEEEE